MTSSGSRAADAPAAGAVELPTRTVSPLTAGTRRMLLATGLLALCALIVYLGRNGYHDSAHPGRPLSPVASVYYAVVTMSTTGYGDIVPVTDTARVVNIVLITPLRVIFLIVLVGTTLEVLTERTRRNWRNARWRSKVTGHAIVVGYGTKGRSVIATLRESGMPATPIVVIDTAARVVAEANAAGLAAVAGDATRRDVLAQAEAVRAAQVAIAVNRDDTAVLVALTARQLSPGPGGRGGGHRGTARRAPAGRRRPGDRAAAARRPADPDRFQRQDRSCKGHRRSLIHRGAGSQGVAWSSPAGPGVALRTGLGKACAVLPRTALIAKASHNHQGAERARQWLEAARASLELYGGHPAVDFTGAARRRGRPPRKVPEGQYTRGGLPQHTTPPCRNRSVKRSP